MPKQLPLLRLLNSKYADISAEQHYARILCGEVSIDGETVRDPKRLVPETASIKVSRAQYVSRGGLKLEAALTEWKTDLRGRTILDVGSSTGGFTDCALQFGAAVVHAVDVGTNQLSYRLRMDSRVRVHEATNIMQVETLEPPPSIALIDMSFRSLRGAASHVLALSEVGTIIALAKPQFEWRDPPRSFRGLVQTGEDLSQVLRALVRDLREEGVAVSRVLESPITGRKGNREFFFELKQLEPESAVGIDVEKMLLEVVEDQRDSRSRGSPT